MTKEKIYIIDSKRASNFIVERKLQGTNCEYVEDINAILKNQNSKIVFILNDHKDCINLFNHRDYRKHIIIASFDREIIKILNRNKNYLDVIDMKKINLGHYLKSKIEEN